MTLLPNNNEYDVDTLIAERDYVLTNIDAFQDLVDKNVEVDDAQTALYWSRQVAEQTVRARELEELINNVKE